MDRQHRRELRHDKFVDEVGVLTGRARENQRLLILIAAAVLLIAVGSYGYYLYGSKQERKAQDVLAVGIETMESQIVNPQSPNPRAKFKTEAERTAAAEKQFKEVQSKYPGTNAADVAGLYVARIAAARGDLATARTLLQKFIADHPKHLLVGSARYSLYQLRIDSGEGRQVATELDLELKKPEDAQVLPGDSLLVILAHAYEAQGNEQKSRDTYRRIVTEFPDSPFALEAQRRVGPA
jgi:TolA-binding protein